MYLPRLERQIVVSVQALNVRDSNIDVRNRNSIIDKREKKTGGRMAFSFASGLDVWDTTSGLDGLFLSSRWVRTGIKAVLVLTVHENENDSGRGPDSGGQTVDLYGVQEALTILSPDLTRVLRNHEVNGHPDGENVNPCNSLRLAGVCPHTLNEDWRGVGQMSYDEERAMIVRWRQGERTAEGLEWTNDIGL
ncbi:hypothetical protein K474DRAFT_1700521 [Panus rudis PR-1116 ss-1]|nr:hypothetical protein K474DRAFT_1700521 [Panus rudis PR-1116 ss-1]